jgi:hypothetical protein
MPRTVPIAIGAGVLSALIFALFLTGSPLAFIISPFTMLPLLLVGLSSSAWVSGVAAVSGVLVMGLIGGALRLAALDAAGRCPPSGRRARLRRRTDPRAAERFTSAASCHQRSGLHGWAVPRARRIAGYDGACGVLAQIGRGLPT